MQFTDKYCGLDLAKEFCGNIKGTDDDNLVGMLTLATSRAVERYTNIYWGPSAVIADEKVRRVLGMYRNMFYTQYGPIISVSSLVDDVYTYQTSDYVVFEDEGKIQLASETPTYRFSLSPGKLKVSYVVGQGAAKAGSYTKGIAAPEDIQLATAIITGSWYRHRDRQDIVSQTTPNSAIVFMPEDIPRKARAILDQRVRPIF